jgi:EAL and modified HD-GYP domain-containing signal transduction protein
MFDHPVLDQLVLGYSPVVDRQRAVLATRLTLFPASPDPAQAASLQALRAVSTVRAGARTTADADAAFGCGAVAVQGWPVDDPPRAAGSRVKVATEMQMVMDLIQGVDRKQPVSQLEAVLRRDPTLAFRLLGHLNSLAFGLRAEITSFGHAILMLGYPHLKRWLSLLLASSSAGAHAKPRLFAAVRRGLLMEALGRAPGDAEMRGEVFICGVFSLLDRMLQQPFGDLLQSVPVPDRVRQTLIATPGTERGGPYSPYLELVGAIERESLFDIRDCSERLLLTPDEVNRALLSALRHAQLLEG